MHKAVVRPEQLKFKVKQVNINPRLWGLVACVLLHINCCLKARLAGCIHARFCRLCLPLDPLGCIILWRPFRADSPPRRPRFFTGVRIGGLTFRVSFKYDRNLHFQFIKEKVAFLSPEFSPSICHFLLCVLSRLRLALVIKKFDLFTFYGAWWTYFISWP